MLLSASSTVLLFAVTLNNIQNIESKQVGSSDLRGNCHQYLLYRQTSCLLSYDSTIVKKRVDKSEARSHDPTSDNSKMITSARKVGMF